MQGRIEEQKSVESKILEKIKDGNRLVIDYYYSLGDGFSYNTKKTYIDYICKFLDFLQDYKGININNVSELNIETAVINEYMESIKYKEKDGKIIEKSASNRSSIFYGIKSFFNYLVQHQYIDKNPCDAVNKIKIKEEHDVVSLTLEEIKIIEENIKCGSGSEKAKALQKKWKNRDLALIYVALVAGLRVSSMCQINVQDVDIENCSIKVTEKGNKTRTCRVGESTMRTIHKWIINRENIMEGYEDCDALFISNERTRISRISIYEIIKKYTYNINKNVTPHKLRSTCATNLYEQTGDIYLVQEVLGHSNIANTKRYAKISEKKREQAAQILDNMFHEK